MVKQYNLQQGIAVPDPIIAEPWHKKITFRNKAIIISALGFLAGWLWMTWAMSLQPLVGLNGGNFWRLLLPF